MAAGRRSPDGDLLGIDAVGFSVCSYPANRRFAIVNLGRPLGFLTQAVADANTDILPRLDEGREALSATALVALSPSTSVDENDGRNHFSSGIARKDEIELLAWVLRACVRLIVDLAY